MAGKNCPYLMLINTPRLYLDALCNW